VKSREIKERHKYSCVQLNPFGHQFEFRFSTGGREENGSLLSGEEAGFGGATTVRFSKNPPLPFRRGGEQNSVQRDEREGQEGRGHCQHKGMTNNVLRKEGKVQSVPPHRQRRDGPSIPL